VISFDRPDVSGATRVNVLGGRIYNPNAFLIAFGNKISTVYVSKRGRYIGRLQRVQRNAVSVSPLHNDMEVTECMTRL
jgi:hypothetical protein